MPKPRVLHVLSQRPSLTGSGITLDAFVRHASDAGYEQAVVCGTPADADFPRVGEIPPSRVHPLLFEQGELDFPVPGMSDVMPYRSTVWSSMTTCQLARYRDAWRRHVSAVIESFEPQLIHAHHVWILGAMIRDLAPGIPVFTQCHATGLRQMQLCPHLAREVKEGVSRNDAFFVLHGGHENDLVRALGVERERVHVIGAGFREELFSSEGREGSTGDRLLYVGKYSSAKGVPSLLRAFAALRARRPAAELHVAGTGTGDEADALRVRMEAMPGVTLHGQIDQPELARLMRASTVMVLPSFYEGLPLVLVEAIACGCRVVATRLPGIEDPLARHLADAMELVDLPRLVGPDVPMEEDLPAFEERLASALERALDAGPVAIDASAFSWRRVFERVERVWRLFL
jgi:glycosyltransferase involved in cell wall biosynthesis